MHAQSPTIQLGHWHHEPRQDLTMTHSRCDTSITIQLCTWFAVVHLRACNPYWLASRHALPRQPNPPYIAYPNASGRNKPFSAGMHCAPITPSALIETQMKKKKMRVEKRGVTGCRSRQKGQCPKEEHVCRAADAMQAAGKNPSDGTATCTRDWRYHGDVLVTRYADINVNVKSLMTTTQPGQERASLQGRPWPWALAWCRVR
jgi:hypothetical protein